LNYKNNELIDKITLLLKNKTLPVPLTKQNPKCLEDMAFEKYLTNKHFWEVPKDEQDLMLGDFMFLTDEAFRYYAFEVILLTLKGQDIPLIDMFLIELLIDDSKYKLHRYTQFSNEELEIIISFLENIVMKIEDEIGDREIYNNLEDWEQEEIYPPFKDYKEEIQTALHYWRLLKDNKSEETNQKPEAAF
jgi:hypothetical protein